MPLNLTWTDCAKTPDRTLLVSFAGGALSLDFAGITLVNADWLLPSVVSNDVLSSDSLTQQIQQYLLSPDSVALSLAIAVAGSSYHRRVWDALPEIPLGQTLSYTELAERLDSGPRAVARACRDNPYPGIIPCHRVVAKNGLGGFMGQAQGQYVTFKKILLDYEASLA